MFHGGKGASLLSMTRLGITTPPGFILTTESYRSHCKDPGGFRRQMEGPVREAMTHIERTIKRRFGNPYDPLLVSVRSGAPVSMPGMMDTILNLGLYPENVCNMVEKKGELFAWGSFLRLISQFAHLVLCTQDLDATLEHVIAMNHPPADGAEARKRSLEALQALALRGTPFPEDPWEQLWVAIGMVFRSWDNDRAKTYRSLQNIPENLGTACTVQAMVFGNRNERSGTGVCFSRDPSTGEPGISGEYLPMGQGEDVVAGLRTPLSIHALPTPLLGELTKNMTTLECDLRDVIDAEFTVEDDVLYLLQYRSAKRSAEAAVRCAHDMFTEGRITEEEMLTRVTTDHARMLLRPHFDSRSLDEARKKGTLLARGLPAGPGAASGVLALDPPQNQSKPFILVRRETSPEDVGAMVKAAGVLTIHGGMSSHAALVARQLGIVCIVGCEGATIDVRERTVWFGEKPVNEGEWISIDGTSGDVYAGTLPMVSVSLDDSLLPVILRHADTKRRLGVYANADTPEQASLSRRHGAEGIGLARTEHMFFGEDRLPLVQRLIVSTSEDERKSALAKLEELQTQDFRGLLLAMDGLPVTVRTIDPPLHEFLPKKDEDITQLAGMLNVSTDELKRRIAEMQESNPMLGFRGCRLGILYPEIPTMQVRALAKATVRLLEEGKNPKPEIMIPLTSTAAELQEHRKILEREVHSVFSPSLPIGTMIEVPRAALVAEELAPFADFLSFGTNDLTQLTFGISRDDASMFLPAYVEKGIYPEDPFVSIDRSGVGKLMEIAVHKARSVKPDMKIGICGEHGGDPPSIRTCEELNLTYVSCSPYRVLIARLAAAQARIR